MRGLARLRIRECLQHELASGTVDDTFVQCKITRNCDQHSKYHLTFMAELRRGTTVTCARKRVKSTSNTKNKIHEKFQNVKYSMSALSNMKLHLKLIEFLFVLFSYCIVVKITTGFIYTFKLFL